MNYRDYPEQVLLSLFESLFGFSLLKIFMAIKKLNAQSYLAGSMGVSAIMQFSLCGYGGDNDQ
jgi:hypothetical protein